MGPRLLLGLLAAIAVVLISGAVFLTRGFTPLYPGSSVEENGPELVVDVHLDLVGDARLNSTNESTVVTIHLRNVGDRALEVESIRLDYRILYPGPGSTSLVLGPHEEKTLRYTIHENICRVSGNTHVVRIEWRGLGGPGVSGSVEMEALCPGQGGG